jgi:hypothetical protein
VNFNFSRGGSWGDFAQVYAVVWMALAVIVHVSFAIGVFLDAKALAQRRGSTTFVPPLIWAAATLIGGVLSVFVYWMVHHSSLNPYKAEAEPKAEPR